MEIYSGTTYTSTVLKKRTGNTSVSQGCLTCQRFQSENTKGKLLQLYIRKRCHISPREQSQSSTGTQQATQGTTQSASSSGILQSAQVTALVVVGAPATTTGAQSSSMEDGSSSEIMAISVFAGIF